jgi:hypothetical protein
MLQRKKNRKEKRDAKNTQTLKRERRGEEEEERKAENGQNTLGVFLQALKNNLRLWRSKDPRSAPAPHHPLLLRIDSQCYVWPKTWRKACLHKEIRN